MTSPTTPAEALRAAADLLEQSRAAPTPAARVRAFEQARDLIDRVRDAMARAVDPIESFGRGRL